MKQPTTLTFSLTEAEVRQAIIQNMKKVAKINVEPGEVGAVFVHDRVAFGVGGDADQQVGGSVQCCRGVGERMAAFEGVGVDAAGA